MALKKPQRLFCLHLGIVMSTMQCAVKRQKLMAGEDAMKNAFSKYATYLNDLNDKRERLVKASRDITMNSKKAIFQVHRIGKDNKDEVLRKAEKDPKAVTDQHLACLLKELDRTDF